MSDIVKRLRHEASLRAHYGDPILEEAADEIERLLRPEVRDVLEEALRLLRERPYPSQTADGYSNDEFEAWDVEREQFLLKLGAPQPQPDKEA